MAEKALGSSVIPAMKKKVEDAVAVKQDLLVSGTNIKTLNGNSVLGEGDITIEQKLYSTYGENTDGSLTQKFASEKMQAVEGYVTTLKTNAGKTVQFDTTVTGDASTVTVTKSTGALDAETPTETGLPLPVASSTQAGVINAATYKTIQATADKVETILNATVAVPDLAAEPTQEQLTEAWKTATGKTELVNGAKILDSTNNKTWTYYAYTSTWQATDNENPTIEVKQFTNDAAGIIKGSTEDGQVSAESDGTGSVNGWDTLKSSVATNTSELTTVKASVSTNTTDIAALKTNKQDKLVGTGEGQNIKTINGVEVLGTGDIAIEVPEVAYMTEAEFNAAWAEAGTTPEA